MFKLDLRRAIGMIEYVFSGAFDDFPSVRGELDATDSVVFIFTADDVLHVQVKSELDLAFADSLKLSIWAQPEEPLAGG